MYIYTFNNEKKKFSAILQLFDITEYPSTLVEVYPSMVGGPNAVVQTELCCIEYKQHIVQHGALTTFSTVAQILLHYKIFADTVSGLCVICDCDIPAELHARIVPRIRFLYNQTNLNKTI